MWRVRILHGPNVKYIGQGREPEWYGTESWAAFFARLEAKYADQVALVYLESPYEGKLIEWVWETEAYDGLFSILGRWHIIVMRCMMLYEGRADQR